MQRLLSIALAAGLAAACSKDEKPAPDDDAKGQKKEKKSAKSAEPPASAAPKSSGTKIEIDPETGKTKVEGGAKLTGDPKVCAAFAACCSASSDAGLFCGMSQANEGDCSKLLASVKQYLEESGAKPPAGCE
jgi:hypothetical protein